MAMLETAEVILDSLSTNGEAIENVTFKPFMSHGPKVYSLSKGSGWHLALPAQTEQFNISSI